MSYFSQLKLQGNTGNLAEVEELGNPITSTNNSVLCKSVIQGKKENGEYSELALTNKGEVKTTPQSFGDSFNLDPFGALRVSEGYTIFDSKQLHDKQPLIWDEQILGSATSAHNPANAATTMTVTANAGDSVIRQTKQRFNYQPGKGQKIFFTFLCSPEAGLTKRAGLFDGTGTNFLTPNNGIFLESTGVTPSWNICKNGNTSEKVEQANWNVDTLDGSGDVNNPSGILLDLNKVAIGIIDFEWLGVGRVRVGFVIDGLIYYTHYFNHANQNFTSVYMSSPNLPMRYSIETDGTAGGSFDHICSTVISEGGQQNKGSLRSINQGQSLPSANYANTKSYALISIRLKADYKDITIIPEAISILIGTSDNYMWSLQMNPVIAGTFTYNDLNDSAVQYAIGDVTNEITTEGLVIGSGYGSKTSRELLEGLSTALKIGTTIAGVSDTLVLVISPVTNNLSVLGALTFRELL